MTTADTPRPEGPPGVTPKDRRDGAPDPAAEVDIKANPQPEPDSSVPLDDDPEIRETERQPT